MKLKSLYILFVLLPAVAVAQTESNRDFNWVRNNYVKTEHVVPMRDGVNLYTSVYTPRDSTRQYPILIQRTPYSCRPYGKDNYRNKLGPNVGLMEEKYIFVYQDVRGRYKSGGNFREMTPAIADKKTNQDVDESSDTYDTIEWLLKNTASTGKVGIYGISFPGYYASAALPDAHPALKAVSPQAPMSDEFIGDDCYHNGAFFLMDNFGFYNGFDGPQSANGEGYKPFFKVDYSDAYRFFLDFGPLKRANTDAFFSDPKSVWRQVTAHPTYDDFWQSRNIRKHLNHVKPAVLVVGGWFDAEDLFGALKTYAAIEKQSPGNNSRLVMGPWTHGAWTSSSWTAFSSYQFGQNVNKFYQEEIETKFFNYHLKGQGSFDLAEATVFETGSNQWKSYPIWPPSNSQQVPYYFDNRGGLSVARPKGGRAFTEYEGDPAKPVPYTDRKGASRNNEYMAEDQRFAAARADVVVFQTDSLSSDLTLTGEIGAELFVSMTGTDADFIVKVIDVHGNGYQQMVRAEVFRGKFRNSFSRPEPFVEDKVEKVSFKLNEVAHTFKRGHRVMVQVQSSWFPLVDRNPQKFINIFEANETDFQKSTIRIHHSEKHQSYVTLPVLR
jgi:putative CocE/NonD family hydrolase